MVRGKIKGILILFFAFTLILLGFASAYFCGNGIKEEGEQCDFGELNGFLCWAPYGNDCQYCTISCKLKTIDGGFCGDGILNSACEECDDGNTISGDGCSSLCKIEENPPEPPVCGDNICNGEETCSSCPSDCGICPPQPPVCGNGILETGEQCDDGNLVNGDGCSSLCKIEGHEEEDNKKGKSTEFVQVCEPNWKCSAWSECDDDGIMTRSCRDMNNCDFSYNKPAETTVCEQKALIKADNTNYTLLLSLGITALLLIILVVLLLKRR